MMGRQLEIMTEIVIYIGMQQLVVIEGIVHETECRVNRFLKISKPQGFNNGLVVNLGEASQTLRSAIDQLLAPDLSEKSLEGNAVWVVIGNPKLNRFSYESSIYFRGESRTITSQEVRRAIQQTRQVATIPLTEVILQVVPEFFLVDDIHGVRNPLGLEARRLGVTLNLFTMNYQEYKNLMRAFDGTDLCVEGVIPKTLTIPECILDESNKKEGAVILDMAEANTQASYWKECHLKGIEDIPLGYSKLAERIAGHYNIELHDAEKLLVQYGSLENLLVASDEIIPLVERHGVTTKHIHRSEFQEFFYRIAKEWADDIAKSCGLFLSKQSASCPNYVLTGAGASLDGIVDYWMQQYSIISSIGTAKKIEAPHELLVDASMTPVLGGLRWVASHIQDEAHDARNVNFFRKQWDKVSDLFYKYF